MLDRDIYLMNIERELIKMKKYKNVKAIKVRKCLCYERRLDNDCLGVPGPFKNPPCNGYKCKCTEYKYNRKEGKLI